MTTLQHPRPVHPTPPQDYQRFSSPPQASPAPPWNLLQDPSAALFLPHAYHATTDYLDRSFTSKLPLAQLKHAFNLDLDYARRKLLLVLFPWRHPSWARQLLRDELSGNVTAYKTPRDDINCPDLYIPLMALTTYILLAALIAGFQGQFDPSILGQTASKALGLLLLEFFCIKLGCYLLGIGEEGTVVDLIAYEGYKFVGIIVVLFGGLLGLKGWSFWTLFLYVFFANFFFLVSPLPSTSTADISTAEIPSSSRPSGPSTFSATRCLCCDIPHGWRRDRRRRRRRDQPCPAESEDPVPVCDCACAGLLHGHSR